MIEFLEGRLAQKSPTHLVIDVGGVGYGLDVSLPASQALPVEGERVRVITYQHVKEGILELYGFKDAFEKQIFLKLISVSGIGPRIALRILSSTTPSQLAENIRNSDILALSKLKGIGKKTAELMVAVLKGTMATLPMPAAGTEGSGSPRSENDSHQADAIKALVALGVKESVAVAGVQKAKAKLGPKYDTNRLIAQALQEV